LAEVHKVAFLDLGSQGAPTATVTQFVENSSHAICGASGFGILISSDVPSSKGRTVQKSCELSLLETRPLPLTPHLFGPWKARKIFIVPLSLSLGTPDPKVLGIQRLCFGIASTQGRRDMRFTFFVWSDPCPLGP
jgi:hypothetical protein